MTKTASNFGGFYNQTKRADTWDFPLWSMYIMCKLGARLVVQQRAKDDFTLLTYVRCQIESRLLLQDGN
jgi:hypothetical protein